MKELINGLEELHKHLKSDDYLDPKHIATINKALSEVNRLQKENTDLKSQLSAARRIRRMV